MSSKMQLPRWPLVALSLLGGCEGGAGTPKPGDTVKAYRGAVDLSIGEMEGAQAYLFGRVSGVALDSAGRIFVADSQADEVRVFSPMGEFLYAIGRKGSGPGELRRPCCIAFDPRGRLWVRDGGNARYNRYEITGSSASFSGSVRMAHGDVNYAAPITFDREGRVIDIGHASDPETGKRQMARFHLDSVGTVVGRHTIHEPPEDSLGVHLVHQQSGNSRSTFYLWPPYGPSHLVAHAPGGDWAEAISSRYAVRWRDQAGSVVRTINRDVGAGPELSAAEQRRGEERLTDYVTRFHIARGDLPFGIPERKPVLRDLAFDQDGRLWVELNTPDGEPRRADVFDRGGAYVATVEWPAEVEVHDADLHRHVALGVARDSLELSAWYGSRSRPGEFGSTEPSNASPH